MENMLVLLIFQVVPISLWALSWYYENKFSVYPDVTKGIKIEIAKKDKNLWLYGNKVAARVLSSIATLLFFINTFGVIISPVPTITIAFSNFIILWVAYIIIRGLIIKKYKSKNN